MQVSPFSLDQQIKDLGIDLEEAVLEVLRSGQYIRGPQIKRFEEAFAASVGCEHAVGCNSGTASSRSTPRSSICWLRLKGGTCIKQSLSGSAKPLRFVSGVPLHIAAHRGGLVWIHQRSLQHGLEGGPQVTTIELSLIHI